MDATERFSSSIPKVRALFYGVDIFLRKKVHSRLVTFFQNQEKNKVFLNGHRNMCYTVNHKYKKIDAFSPQEIQDDGNRTLAIYDMLMQYNCQGGRAQSKIRFPPQRADLYIQCEGYGEFEAFNPNTTRNFHWPKQISYILKKR